MVKKNKIHFWPIIFRYVQHNYLYTVIKSSEISRVTNTGLENMCNLSTSFNSYCFEGEDLCICIYTHTHTHTHTHRDKSGLFFVFRMERHTALMQGTMAMWHVLSITCVSQICCQYGCSLIIRTSTFHALPSLRTEISKPMRSWGGSIPCKRVQCFRGTCCLYLQVWTLIPEDRGNMIHPQDCIVSQSRRLQSNQLCLLKLQSMYDILILSLFCSNPNLDSLLR
jgi:hypothetical protein